MAKTVNSMHKPSRSLYFTKYKNEEDFLEKSSGRVISVAEALDIALFFRCPAFFFDKDEKGVNRKIQRFMKEYNLYEPLKEIKSWQGSFFCFSCPAPFVVQKVFFGKYVPLMVFLHELGHWAQYLAMGGMYGHYGYDELYRKVSASGQSTKHLFGPERIATAFGVQLAFLYDRAKGTGNHYFSIYVAGWRGENYHESVERGKKIHKLCRNDQTWNDSNPEEFYTYRHVLRVLLPRRGSRKFPVNPDTRGYRVSAYSPFPVDMLTLSKQQLSDNK